MITILLKVVVYLAQNKYGGVCVLNVNVENANII